MLRGILRQEAGEQRRHDAAAGEMYDRVWYNRRVQQCLVCCPGPSLVDVAKPSRSGKQQVKHLIHPGVLLDVLYLARAVGDDTETSEHRGRVVHEGLQVLIQVIVAHGEGDAQGGRVEPPVGLPG